MIIIFYQIPILIVILKSGGTEARIIIFILLYIMYIELRNLNYMLQ